jgi:lipopolysaccharide biosynthesis regulator YciM
MKAAPPRRIAAHYLCELATAAIERGESGTARQLLRAARGEMSPFPRAALLRAQIAERDADGVLAARLLRAAVHDAPQLLLEELPHMLRLAAPGTVEAMLTDLVALAESSPPDGLKALVFAAILAGLAEAPPLRHSIEKVIAQDATLSAVWAPGADPQRIAREIGALLAHAEQYRCTECGFAGRRFYWHCPACHAWEGFEMHAIVKLG